MHSQERWRRVSAAALATTALAVGAPAAAQASIWTTVNTPTTQTITAIDYQGGDRLWFTTSSSIYKRNGSSWTPQLDQPGSNFNSIEFNPSGTRGLAVGDAGVVWRFNGSTWNQLALLMTYNHPNDGCPGPARTPRLPRSRPTSLACAGSATRRCSRCRRRAARCCARPTGARASPISIARATARAGSATSATGSTTCSSCRRTTSTCCS
jgi:hypothetical protein